MSKVKAVIIAAASTVMLLAGAPARCDDVGDNNFIPAIKADLQSSPTNVESSSDSTVKEGTADAARNEEINSAESTAAMSKATAQRENDSTQTGRGNTQSTTLNTPRVAINNQKPKNLKHSFIRKLLAPVTDLQTQSIRLQEQIIRLERPIEDLRPSISKLPERVSSLENYLTMLHTNMINIKDELSALHGDINVVQRQIRKVEKPISELQDPVTRLYKPITDLDSPIKTLQHEIGDFRNQIDELRSQMKQMSKPISALSQPISQLQGPINDLPKSITDVRAELSDLRAQLAELHAAINKTTFYVLIAILLATFMIAIGTPLVSILLWRLLGPSTLPASQRRKSFDSTFANHTLSKPIAPLGDRGPELNRTSSPFPEALLPASPERK